MGCVNDLERRVELRDGQSPRAIVICCADSRSPPELIFDRGYGDLFVIRCGWRRGGTTRREWIGEKEAARGRRPPLFEEGQWKLEQLLSILLLKYSPGAHVCGMPSAESRCPAPTLPCFPTDAPVNLFRCLQGGWQCGEPARAGQHLLRAHAPGHACDRGAGPHQVRRYQGLGEQKSGGGVARG